MMQAPRPRRDSRAITQLGRTRHDDFAWMKDENWQQVLRDPGILRADIAAHLREENAYAEAVLTGIEPLRAALVKEMIGRIPPAEESVPVPDGAWEYYARYADGAQHPLHARRPRGGGEETVLLDVDALAKQHPYYALGGAAHSDDHALYVYAEDVQGSEVYRIQVKDLASGALCAPPVESLPPVRLRYRRTVNGCSGRIAMTTGVRHVSIAARSVAARTFWFSTNRMRVSFCRSV